MHHRRRWRPRARPCSGLPHAAGAGEWPPSRVMRRFTFPLPRDPSQENIGEREEPKIRATAALDADHVPHALGNLGRFLIRVLFIHVE